MVVTPLISSLAGGASFPSQQPEEQVPSLQQQAPSAQSASPLQANTHRPSKQTAPSAQRESGLPAVAQHEPATHA
jgi:hypothetical protein